MALSGSSYGDSIFQLQNPSQNYYNLQKDQAALNSNSLEDQVRRNNIEIGKQQAQQEATKTQEVDEQWKAMQAYNKARQQATKLIPNPGYTDQADASQPAAIPTGTDPVSGRPSLAMDNGAVPGGQANSAAGAVTSSAPANSTMPPDETPSMDTLMANSLSGAVDPAPQAASAQPIAPTASPVAPVTDSTPSLKPMNQNDPSTYAVQVDEDKLQQIMDQHGYGSYGLAQSQARAKALTAVLDMHIKAHDLASKQMTSIANAAAAIPQVNWNEPDPQVLQNQKNSAVMIARQQYRNLLANGIIKPAQEAEYEQALAGGWTPELQQKTLAIANSATAANEQQTQALARNREYREQVTANSTNEERAATALQKNLSNAAQTVSGVTDQASLDSWYQRQPKGVQDAVGAVYKQGYSPATLAKIRQMGQTEEQKATLQVRRDGQEATNDYREGMLSIRRDIAARGSASDKADQRQAQTKLLQLQRQEEPLYGQIAQLQSAVKSGKIFVTKTGQVQPLTTANRGDESLNDSLKQDMQERLEGLKTQAASLINEKYDLVEQHGGQPKVSRDAALKGVGREAAPPAPPSTVKAPAAPAQKTTPAAAPAKYTESQVRAAATAKGKDPDAAVVAAKAKNLIQ